MSRLSIRMRITLGLSIAAAIILIMTFTIMSIVSASVMRKTVRDYLISAVEENTDKLVYYPEDTEEMHRPGYLIMSCGEGWLRIDEDFLDIMNDVESALYTEDGELLYGRDPLASDDTEVSFDGSRVYLKETGKIDNYIYDRKIELEGAAPLWIRGTVPLTQETRQVADIRRTMLAFLPMILVVVLVCGFFVARGILRPVRSLERSASEISGGTDLKKRITAGSGNDEISKLAGTFNSMLDRIEDSFESEKKFTSDASHELRTPISVIRAQTDLILEEERSPEEYVDAVRVIARQNRRLDSLVNDLLDYTRLDRRLDEYVMEETDLSELAQTLCDDMALIAFNGIELRSEIEPGVMVKGNRKLLTRLLQNLIDNAYKYGKPEGHTLVTLRREAANAAPGDADGRAVLAVEDDGRGISENEKERIFERFYRGEGAADGPAGNGLGLSMVKKIADMHGAEVALTSELGKGSRFEVRF